MQQDQTQPTFNVVPPVDFHQNSPRNKAKRAIIVTVSVFTLAIIALVVYADLSAKNRLANELSAQIIDTPAGNAHLNNAITTPDGSIWFSYYTDGKTQIGRMKADGSFDTVTSLDIAGGIQQMVSGNDGAVWEIDQSALRSITPAGEITRYELPAGFYAGGALGIHLGNSGDRWITDVSSNKVVHMATNGKMNLYPIPNDYELDSAAIGKDNNLWITAGHLGYVYKDFIILITPEGKTVEYKLPTPATEHFLLPGSDGNLWYSAKGQDARESDKIARISQSGEIKEFDLPQGYSVTSPVLGPDGAIWFGLAKLDAFSMSFKVGKVSPDGKVSSYNLPGEGSANNLINIPGKGIWIGDVEADTISHISLDGKVTRHSLSYEFSPYKCSLPFASPDGNLWYLHKDKASFCKVNIE